MSKTCARFSEGALSDYTDGALSALAMWRVRRHLVGCSECAASVRELEALNQAAQQLYIGPSSAAAPLSRKRHLPVRPLLAGAVALIAAGVWFAPEMPGQPRIVFADVENAMEQVKTMQWTVTSQHIRFIGNRKMVETTRLKSYAQLDPPAFASDWDIHRSDFSGRTKMESRHFVQTTEGELSRGTFGDWSSAKYRSRDRSVRKRINTLLFPHQTHSSINRPHASWQQSSGLLNGAKVLIFRSVAELQDERVQHEETAWVNSKTRRLIQFKIVHTRRDKMEDGSFKLGEQQTAIQTGYRYNEPLPAGIFGLAPPPGTNRADK